MIESTLLTRLGGYIDGNWVIPRGVALDVLNPANGQTLAQVGDLGAADAVRAILAAEQAVRGAPALQDRRRWLLRIEQLLLQHKHELARIITLEQGKPLAESVTEVEYAAGFFKFFAAQLSHLEPREMPEPLRGLRWTVHHKPAGVVGLITPWNFPLAMLAKKLSAALAAGCAVVAKPAELTPLTAIALWHLMESLDMPPGLTNLLIGRPEPIGDALCSHPAVRLISFTGSTDVGRLLVSKTAPHVKRLALELGGNAPFIVMDHADLALAAGALMANKFRCAGQTCVCANRVLVHEAVADDFIDLLARRVGALRVGDGLVEGTQIGPLISDEAVRKVRRHVTDAIERGAKKVIEAPVDHSATARGSFAPPVLLDRVTAPSLMFGQETFGPVVGVVRFAAEDEAVELANGTIYGLAAYVFTRDDAQMDRITRRLVFGHVGQNSGMGPTPEAPFGGMKQSGFGREGGVDGLLEFCDTQTVVRG